MVLSSRTPPGVRIIVTLGTAQTITAAKTFSADGAAITLSSGTGAIVIGTNPAATGAGRFANAALIAFRNAANTADIDTLTVTSGNVIRLGPGAISVQISGGSGSVGLYGTTPIAQGATVADAPAGGTGAAAGAWDTAANRDAAIARINDVIARLRAIGLIAT